MTLYWVVFQPPLKEAASLIGRPVGNPPTLNLHCCHAPLWVTGPLPVPGLPAGDVGEPADGGPTWTDALAESAAQPPVGAPDPYVHSTITGALAVPWVGTLIGFCASRAIAVVPPLVMLPSS